MMPELVAPTVHLHASWLEAHGEWGPGLHEDGFGLVATDEVDSAAGFAKWVGRLIDDEIHGGANGVRYRYRWIVEGVEVVGGIALRYGPDELLTATGHIGYGIRPSARGRGIATWALGRMLDAAHGLGMDRVLLVCANGNTASARTIEHHGGVLEGVQDTELGPARRYRISLGERCATPQ